MSSITPTTLDRKFGCGDSDYAGLRVVVFDGPNGAQIVAYCCNMNIDVDGSPQSYGPEDDNGSPQGAVPTDSLEDGGWLRPSKNEAKKTEYLKLKGDLPNWQTQLDALPADASAATKKELQEKIKNGKKRLAELNPYPPTAKHFEKKFWDWYGPLPLTPQEALRRKQRVKGEQQDRYPWLADGVSRGPGGEDPQGGERFEDVNGRYPIIQWDNEPGQRHFFVSALARRVNADFPEWDQRSTLQQGEVEVEPYGALSAPLKNATGLELGHHQIGLRLDNGSSLAMKFRDSGNKPRVGECSLPAFKALGGTVPASARFPIANHVSNNFLLLYIALRVTDPADIQQTFRDFSQADNAWELPVMLAFVADETVKATGTRVPGNGLITVTIDPMRSFATWQGLAADKQFPPSSYDRVRTYLMSNGFTAPGHAFPTAPPPPPPPPPPQRPQPQRAPQRPSGALRNVPAGRR